MLASTTDLLPHKKPLQIKEDDKFFCRLLSKETSMANPSFRVYHGGIAVTVPFTWESQPGTPKHSLSEATLPPLTPPPSYFSNAKQRPVKKHSRSNLFHFLFSRIHHKKTSKTMDEPRDNNYLSSSASSLSSSPSFASSASSSWSFWTATPTRKCRNGSVRSRFSSFDSRALIFEEQEFESPNSTLCFGGSRGNRW
ncbi:uncharacterized protein LOC126669013 [Mercurialis annua]|uniref:uncharacterized protein LOC126669013 n=1 Tax=Mercurialis annua TaxID=3986 RepID=UPI00215E1026|nr:uncharacterized protein LOC126669013 [Mercurialis annua]